MSKKKWEMDRRTFLRCSMGGAGTMIGLPLLNCMLPNQARGAPAAQARRFLAVKWPHGVPLHYWMPNELKGKNPKEDSFTQLEGNQFTLNYAMNPLQAHKDLINIFVGLDNFNCKSGHLEGPVHFLTGTGFTKINFNSKADVMSGGPSIDQLIAHQMFENMTAAQRKAYLDKIPLYNLASDNTAGADGGYHYSRTVSWGLDGKKQDNENRPELIFARLFGGFKPPATGVNVDLALKRQKNVLDFVLGDIKSLMNKLGAEDKITMQEYLSSVEDLQRETASVQTEMNASCTVPEYGWDNSKGPSNNTGNIGNMSDPTLFKKHVDLMKKYIVAAFQCDRMKVITYSFADSSTVRQYRNLVNQVTPVDKQLPMVRDSYNNALKDPKKIDVLKRGYHDISHEDQGEEFIQAMGEVARWFSFQMADLLTQMRAKGLMDDTLVMYGSEMSCAAAHNGGNVPTVLFGNCGGIKSNTVRAWGRVEFGHKAYVHDLAKGSANYLHSRSGLLVQILNAYGVKNDKGGAMTMNDFGLGCILDFDAEKRVITGLRKEDVNNAARKIKINLKA